MLGDKDDLRASFLHLLSHLLLREGKRVTSTVHPSGRTAGQGLASILDRKENDSEATMNGYITAGSDEAKTTDDELNIHFKGNGSELCAVLLRAHDKNLQDKTEQHIEEKTFVESALKSLFCVSQGAKETAVRGM